MHINRYAIKPDFTVNTSLYLIQCGVENCSPNHSFGPCFRDHNLIHFVLKGKGVLEIQDEIITVSEGQGFLIPTGINAKYTADSKDPWVYCWLGFDGECSDIVMSFCGLSSICNIFTFKEHDKVVECINSLVNSFGKNGNDFITISKMFEIFSYINTSYQHRNIHHQTFLINRIFEYIEENFKHNITVEDISKKFNISRTQLFRYFKESVHMPPQQYIKRYRINYAATLLRTTNMTIAEICTESGFNDLSNFSRQFSNVYHRSPQAFRKYVNEHKDSIKNRNIKK